jgi:prophage antirepressor-like protein
MSQDKLNIESYIELDYSDFMTTVICRLIEYSHQNEVLQELCDHLQSSIVLDDFNNALSKIRDNKINIILNERS